MLRHFPRRRGNESCAAAVAGSLPILTRAFLVKGAETSTELYSKAITAWHVCTEALGSAFWEFQLRDSDWPDWLGLEAKIDIRRNFFIDGHLHVFLCAPSPSPYTGIVGESHACQTPASLLKEALPLMLDYSKQLHGKLLYRATPKGTARVILGGWQRRQEVLQLLLSLKSRAVEHEQQQLRPRLRAAVCIAGLARSFHLARVYKSIADAIRSLKVETQIFYVLDLQGRPIEDFDEAWKALPPDGMVLYDEQRGTGARLPKCHWATPNHVNKMFEKFRSCLHLITAAEKSQRQRFDWAVRLRPDFEWLAPIGNLRTYDAQKVHIVRHWIHLDRFYDTTDFFALVPRKYVRAYFGVHCPLRSQVRTAAFLDLCYGLICNSTDCTVQPECALQLRLRSHGVPVEPFPPITNIVRESTCQPGDLKCLAGWDILAWRNYPERCFLCFG